MATGARLFGRDNPALQAAMIPETGDANALIMNDAGRWAAAAAWAWSPPPRCRRALWCCRCVVVAPTHSSSFMPPQIIAFYATVP